MVTLYFNNFENGKKYCVDVLAEREFVVNDAANAGVQVFDYEKRGKYKVEIWRFHQL